MQHEELLSIGEIWLSEYIITKLKRLLLDYKEISEICGIIAGQRNTQKQTKATELFPLPNISTLDNSFSVDVEEYILVRDKILKKGLLPLIFYHSHPYGCTTPSIQDLELPNLLSLPCMIVSIRDQELVYYCFSQSHGEKFSIDIDR